MDLKLLNSRNVPETSSRTHNMKFVATIFAILAVTGPLNAYKIPATGSGVIAKHLQDILDLMPLDEMVQLTQAYDLKDSEFQLLMSYMRSTQSKLFIQYLEAAPIARELADYLQNNGLDIYALANKLNEALDLAAIVPQGVSDREIIGGIVGYIQDLSQLITLKDLEHMFEEKMQNSKSFSDYVKFCNQPKFVNFYHSLSKNVHFLTLKQQLADVGMNVESFNTYYTIYLIALVVVT